MPLRTGLQRGLAQEQRPAGSRNVVWQHHGAAAAASAAHAESAAAGTSDAPGADAVPPTGEEPEVDVRQILSDPGIEGDPLHFLKVTEAYWKVGQ